MTNICHIGGTLVSPAPLKITDNPNYTTLWTTFKKDPSKRAFHPAHVKNGKMNIFVFLKP